MARIRTIKPDFFRHGDLFDAEKESKLPLRIAYIGLWTVCDREGRFKWKPRDLKVDCLPFDDVDFSRVLDALERHKFVVKYEADGQVCGVVPGFLKHQVINQREAKSTLPPPPFDVEHVHAHACTESHMHIPDGANITDSIRSTVYARDGGKCLRCGTKEDLTVDHIFPRSLGGSHAITNLRTLCRACNSARPVAGEALIADLAKDGLTLSDMPRMCAHVHAHGEGKGKEGKGKEGAPGTRKPTKTKMPSDFCVSERVRTWATEKGHSQLEEHLESFKAKCAAKGYEYVDWDAAFMEAVRENWAKLAPTPKAGAANQIPHAPIWKGKPA